MFFTSLFSHTFCAIHMAGMLAVSFYGWVPDAPRETLDTAYLATFAVLPLSWMMCRDECFLSVLWKHMAMAQGDVNNDDEDDITMALLSTGLSKEGVVTALYTVQAARVVSVWNVHQRSGLVPRWILLPTLVLYLVYVDDIGAKRRGWWWQPWLRLALGAGLMRILWEVAG